ncbi:glycosyltransferase family 2 protein [Halobacillus sp. A5]|uniref:glycosyltransferase family 2 protein n=1 Tax=Halobacillus sp. A5 TaxID=2880263 RepID=UPI0020A66638|nr:glycosyltransferase family 2 protein [Halobacillus sp. A5]MCP3027771.1 glycosyltransferase [Halobacillus sp. A5]
MMDIKKILPFTKSNDDQYFEKVNYKVHNYKALSTKTDVTVVIPVYNAEEYLAKTIDSVIVQNIGFSKITMILIDDGSNDKSRTILKRYAELYSNIVVVFLDENTGTPSFPRNLGAHLANSKYLTFLDADDWLAHDGIKHLYQVLESTKCDYAVGKTIQVNAKSEKIIGKYESCKNRTNVSPFSIPHIFYHLGPRARMMRLSFIKKNKIRFPEMKYAEDKQFFIDVLTSVGKISTTTASIYYLNRIPGNDSLTKQTDIIEKMDTNIAVLKYVLDKKLKIEEEKMIVNRLVEFDSITRLFNRKHFVTSSQKQLYYEAFEQVVNVFNSYERPYSLEEIIKKPLNKAFFKFLTNKQHTNVQSLAEWSTEGGEESRTLNNGLPYTLAHLKNGESVLMEIPVEARVIREEAKEDLIKFEIELTGHHIPKIQSIEFKSRSSAIKTFTAAKPLTQKKNRLDVKIKAGHLKNLQRGGYVIYLIYDDYESVMISKESDAAYELKSSKKMYNFYQTINGNLSIKVKKVQATQ